ncbi:MAG: ABC transporter permease, partial [Clostridia bacterium]|nr:ABC transporter permease [Clostridia bacterium]
GMIWKEYSGKYLKSHKVSSISIMAAALVSSLFISFITTLFYNMWADSVRRAVQKGGDWQAGAGPTLLTGFYFVIMCMVCLSMALVLYHAFVMGADERMHQLGILQTVGATPGQIRVCLLQEALALSLLPVLAGIAAGVGAAALFLHMANSISRALGMEAAYLTYHPFLFLLTLAICVLTVGAAGGRAAIQMSRISPLDAVMGGREQPVRQVKSFRFFSKIWGVEGELAGKSLYARRKAFRASSLSLTLSFMVFSLFLNFWVLSGLSTKYTYFERYKNTWDLMAAVRGEDDVPSGLLEGIRSLSGAARCIRYETAEGYTWLEEGMLSEELIKAGGLDSLKNTGIQKLNGRYKVKVSMVILDRGSFQAFLEESGLDRSVTEVTVNRIWDNVNSHFRARTYLPFFRPMEFPVTVEMDEGGRTGENTDGKNTDGKNVDGKNSDNKNAGIMQLHTGAYTNRVPDLREEYPDFSLVHIMPEQVYEEKMGGRVPEEVHYQIKAVSEEAVPELEESVRSLLDGKSDYELENRQTEEAYEMDVRRGYQLIMGSLCGLLALVGIANVYANTLGGLYMRKREFARYLSVGVTPKGLARILATEACIVGLRPVLASIPVNIGFVIFTVRQSRLMFRDYLAVIPLKPLALFWGVILVFVGMAYWTAGRRINGVNIVEGMRDDTMI